MKNNFLFLILVAVTIWAAPLDCDSFVDRWADDARIPDQTIPDPENYVCFSDGSTLSAFNKDALKTAIMLDPAQAISCQSVQKFLSYVCLQLKPDANLKDPNIQILKYSDAEVFKKAQAECDKYIIIGNHVWEQVEQPRYYYTTFGLGNNHGGTGFFISFIDDSSIDKSNAKFYFMPEQLKEALDTVLKVATSRGDTESVKSIKKCHPTIYIV